MYVHIHSICLDPHYFGLFIDAFSFCIGLFWCRDLYKCARYTQWGDLLPVSGIDENTNNRKTKTRGRIEERQDDAKDEEREVGEGKNEHLQR